MKKLLMLGAIALITLPAFAQEKTPRYMKYTIKSGLMFSRFLYENKSDQATTKSNTEFYVTALIEMPVHKVLSFQTGIGIVGKGNQAVTASKHIEYTDLLYLEVPVNLVAKLDAGPGKVLLGAGPYIGVGLDGGIVKRHYATATSPAIDDPEKDIRFSNSPNEYQTIDFGFNFLLGYQFKNGIGINAGYSLGVTDIYHDTATNQKMRNSGFSTGLSFTF